MASTGVLARIRSRRPLIAVFPTRRLAGIVLAAGGLWLIPGRVGSTIAFGAAFVIGAAAAFDYTRLPRRGNLRIERSIPESIGLGDVVELRYVIRMTWPWPARAELFDEIPFGIGATIPETPFVVAAHSEQTIVVDAEGETRGRYRFDDVALRLRTPLGLVSRYVREPLVSEVVVVPSLTNVRRFRLLSMQRRLSDAGIRALKQRGEGTSFSGLRDYVPGDDPRLLDWKSTARHQRLISREQSIERSQTVISLIDCGRAMTQLAGQHSRFEHVLSAALVLSDVAASSGDRVGLIAFDETVRAFVPPQRGTAALRTLRAALSALDATLTEEEPARLDRYYAALSQADPTFLQTAINRLSTRQSDKVAYLVTRFLQERFLYDYLEDGKLLVRLNHVMRRVGLPQLPAHLTELFPAMRGEVRSRRHELLSP